MCGNLLERLSGVECIQKKLPSRLCATRTLVGYLPKRIHYGPPCPVSKY